MTTPIVTIDSLYYLGSDIYFKLTLDMPYFPDMGKPI